MKRRNAITTITVYRSHGMLVFDDRSVGLIREPFVAGADDMLDAMARSNGLDVIMPYNVLFSDRPFPEALTFTRLRREFGGATYVGPDGATGWLCPALMRYFRRPPKRIHALTAASVTRGGPSAVLWDELTGDRLYDEWVRDYSNFYANE